LLLGFKRFFIFILYTHIFVAIQALAAAPAAYTD